MLIDMPIIIMNQKSRPRVRGQNCNSVLIVAHVASVATTLRPHLEVQISPGLLKKTETRQLCGPSHVLHHY